jgi:hypothetical protein
MRIGIIDPVSILHALSLLENPGSVAKQLREREH